MKILQAIGNRIGITSTTQETAVTPTTSTAIEPVEPQVIVLPDQKVIKPAAAPQPPARPKPCKPYGKITRQARPVKVYPERNDTAIRAGERGYYLEE